MPKLSKVRVLSPSEIAAMADPRQQGLRAFQTNRFDEAIRIWTPLAERDEPVRAALAEVYFRRALKNVGDLEDLRQAARLAPDDTRYQYHLGMRLHQAGDLPAAIACYRQVVERGGPHGAAVLLALALLEHDPKGALATAPGSTPEIRAVLAPVQALLNGGPPPQIIEESFAAQLRRALGLGQSDAETIARLWRGLSQIAANNDATGILDEGRSLSNQQLTAIRRNYRGVAAARAGDLDAALALWRKVYDSGIHTAALLDNIAAALHTQLDALLGAGDLPAAAALALSTVALPLSSAALNELRVQALDGAARTAAVAGEWARAAELWEGARQIVAASTGLGSPRPFWHNLALACEAQERWLDAAEAWRGMLRTRPRKRGAQDDTTLSEAQWAWVRKRVIECYQHAGRPDEAVTVFRQMIKAAPNDLDLRLQLADALLANQQEQAAFNEVQRILTIDPHFADAQARNAALLAARGYLGQAEQALRAAVAEHPEREDLRRQLARMLLDHAGHYVGSAMEHVAEPLLNEGQQLDPENWLFPLNMARVRFNQDRPDDARRELDRALELGGERPDVYMNVFRCWLIEEDIEAARAIISRAEAALKLPAEFYAQLGIMTIVETAPPPPPINPFMMLSGELKKPPPPENTPWTEFGRALLKRAVEQRPNDMRLHSLIASSLLASRPDIAQSHADEAARLAPDDPNAQILRGVVLGLNERKREAKEQLRKAATLARKQGLRDLAAQADDMRREIDSPLFRAAFQMRTMLEDLEDEIDIDDLF